MSRSTSQKSIGFAKCPHHVSDGTGRNAGLTGLVAVDKDTRVFRDHTKRVGKVTIACPGSGLIWEGATVDSPH